MGNSWDPVINTPEYEATLERALSFAKESGLILNPDEKRVEKVIGLMTMNYNTTGKYFCPCKQSHPLDTENDTICPCSTIEDEIEAEGHCYCRLFYKKD